MTPSQTPQKQKSTNFRQGWPLARWAQTWGFFGVIAGSATCFRVLVGTRGHNYDFASFLVVADAIHSGQTPWETNRYNYGPLWAGFLYIVKSISVQDETFFRILVILCLTAAEIILAALLWRQGYRFVATLILFSPVNLIIIGFHNQIDILAILFAYISVIYLSKQPESNRAFVISLLFLGISLTFKHIFVFFPLWLAFRKFTWKKRALILTVPYAIFLSSFLPFFNSFDAISRNVFGYSSSKNAAFLYYFISPERLPSFFPTLIMVGALIGLGLWMRNVGMTKSFFVYMIALVTFTSAMANQYLLIAAIGACGLLLVGSRINVGLLFFLVLSSLFLIVDINGLHSESENIGLGLVNPFSEYGVLLIVLAIGLFQYLNDFRQEHKGA